MLNDVPFECIINIDDLEIKERTTSLRSFCTFNTDGYGAKRSKERITLSLGLSATGEKFCTQVIANSARPCALKEIPDINKAFGIICDHQVKAWRDTSYMRVVHRHKKLSKQRNVTFYIFQDICSSYVCAVRILHPMFSQKRLFNFRTSLCFFFAQCYQ
jgi:hypothetical protein